MSGRSLFRVNGSAYPAGCMHLLASLCRAGPGLASLGLCRAASRTMGDVAAGKKAAAIKAVNEWIKVPRPITVPVHHTDL